MEIKIHSISFLLLLIHQIAIAQPPEHDILFSYEIENKLAAQELSGSSASYYYTYISDYQNAVSNYDVPVAWGVDTLDFSGFKIAKAIDKIIEVAKLQKIIIISESHLKPQHRIFAKELIDSLASYGFRHLGMETLTSDMENKNQLLDGDLNQRGFPLNSTLSGYYTREPHAAELVRTALKRNYSLFGYERQEKILGKDRDEIQADNIVKYIEKSEVDKFIIYCGFHHAIESDEMKRGRSFWMAKYIKDKTGIDPLTIYQGNFTEKQTENEHPILQENLFLEPSVFVNDSGELIQVSGQVDIEVIHPKTDYIDGRPSWLFQNSHYKKYFLDKTRVTIKYPFFVKAYNIDEQETSVPVDIVELKHEYDHKPLVLKKGTFIIRVDNKQEKQEFEIAIE